MIIGKFYPISPGRGNIELTGNVKRKIPVLYPATCSHSADNEI